MQTMCPPGYHHNVFFFSTEIRHVITYAIQIKIFSLFAICNLLFDSVLIGYQPKIEPHWQSFILSLKMKTIQFIFANSYCK